MNCPITPLNGFIVITAIEMERQTAAGIFMPEIAREVMSKGTVVSAPDESYKDADDEWVMPTVNVGDVVLYHKANCTNFRIDNQDFWLIKESNLYGILKNDK